MPEPGREPTQQELAEALRQLPDDAYSEAARDAADALLAKQDDHGFLGIPQDWPGRKATPCAKCRVRPRGHRGSTLCSECFPSSGRQTTPCCAHCQGRDRRCAWDGQHTDPCWPCTREAGRKATHDVPPLGEQNAAEDWWAALSPQERVALYWAGREATGLGACPLCEAAFTDQRAWEDHRAEHLRKPPEGREATSRDAALRQMQDDAARRGLDPYLLCEGCHQPINTTGCTCMGQEADDGSISEAEGCHFVHEKFGVKCQHRRWHEGDHRFVVEWTDA